MSTPIRLFTRLVRSLILRGGGESRTNRWRNQMEPGRNRARCMAFRGERRTWVIFYSFRGRNPLRGTLLFVCDADTHASTVVCGFLLVRRRRTERRRETRKGLCQQKVNYGIIPGKETAQRFPSYTRASPTPLPNPFLSLTFDDRYIPEFNANSIQPG